MDLSITTDCFNKLTLKYTTAIVLLSSMALFALPMVHFRTTFHYRGTFHFEVRSVTPPFFQKIFS